MLSGWTENLLAGIRAFNQVLTAGIAITAFSLFLYSLTFNLRDRVARSFAIILLCVVVVFTTEALQGPSSTTCRPADAPAAAVAWNRVSSSCLSASLGCPPGHRRTTIAWPAAVRSASDLRSVQSLSARAGHGLPGGAARAERPARTAFAEDHLD